MSDPGELLTVGDVGRILGCGGANVKRLTKNGEITPAYLTPDGDRLYRRSDAEALKAKRDAARQGV